MAIDLSNAQLRLRVLRIGFGDAFVLLQSGIGLPIIEQVLRQPAQRIQIFAVQFHRTFVGVDGLLVLMLLLVGVAERRVKPGGAAGIRHGLQSLDGALAIALFGV